MFVTCLNRKRASAETLVCLPEAYYAEPSVWLRDDSLGHQKDSLPTASPQNPRQWKEAAASLHETNHTKTSSGQDSVDWR